MNTLFQHIEYLLLRHDCVIVPGLGAFISTIQPARIDMENHRILPPARSVMFNQAVTVDDGLLANSYARRFNISFEEGRQLIVRDVKSLKDTIISDGAAICGRLGKLYLGEESKLTFSPASDTLSSAGEYGFMPACMQMKKQENVSMPSGSTTEKSSDKSCADSPLPHTDASAAEKNYYHLKISKTFLRIASAVAVIFAVALTVILNPVPRDSREQRASVVPVEALMPAIEKKTNATDTLPTATSESERIDEPHIPSHYLIVATFSSRKEAETYAATYSTDEFPLTTVSSRKMTRVAIASSDDRDSLRMKLNSSPISHKYPQAWIWSRL